MKLFTVPQTYDQVVAWFTLPGKNGERGTHDEAMLRELLTGMQARPDFDEPMTPSLAWNLIIEYSLLYRGARRGWVRRDGVVLGAGLSAHDRLLRYLGIDTGQAEADGWARLHGGSFQCLYRLTRDQRDQIEAVGILVDDGLERRKPQWRKSTQTQ